MESRVIEFRFSCKGIRLRYLLHLLQILRNSRYEAYQNFVYCEQLLCSKLN